MINNVVRITVNKKQYAITVSKLVRDIFPAGYLSNSVREVKVDRRNTVDYNKSRSERSNTNDSNSGWREKLKNRR